MENLPTDILSIIWDYLPDKKKTILNKFYYEKYHYIIEDQAKNPIRFYISYIRKIIRNDLDYVFSVLLKNNYHKWKKEKKKKFNYIKTLKSNNFLDSLNLLCIEYNASKCRNLLFLNTKET